MPVPLTIPAGEVIIYRYDMNPFAGQRIEVRRERAYQRFNLQPVAISAILPECNTAPPMSCTS